jgi:hypothetical protein
MLQRKKYQIHLLSNYRKNYGSLIIVVISSYCTHFLGNLERIANKKPNIFLAIRCINPHAACIIKEMAKLIL